MVSTSRSNEQPLVRLCHVDDVAQDEPVHVDLPGFAPLAVYEVDGEYFVTDNVCTHAYSLLTDGFQEGDEIECVVHGGTFDIRSGAATAFPCRTPLKTYHVEIVNGWVAIADSGGAEAESA